MATKTIAINISDNQGYSSDQVETSVTLGSILESIQEAIEEYGEDTKVVLYNGQRYGATFGKIDTEYGEGMISFMDPSFAEDDEF
ncbi:hypothetical protein FDJ44_gp54 [Microbacterium phage Pikmin]|uniref:Uncharacterized protein n=3 Tax=Pikminvirus pikmin TaxID=2560596 RepID=A0A2P1CKL7_9CAUD|nr:hypothetical protein FDJ44_gp54 [Microbacterium phage Pikmin]AVJ51045.1 hypothetical protein PBI_PAJAZA_54 [Microbacterium phage Pajaza]AVJ51192.1 hypothetical protein PBI_PIKMIN_54 [Microbacterium phage Pikmin]AVJ51750.1 hypothetical protein PBI_CASEY_54 [Microbacterium phage Casey]